MRFQAPRGTEDVLPADAHRWQFLEDQFRVLAKLYSYDEIRTPSFEDTDLFIRSSGETSDIVTKQMYNFTDKGGRPIAFKPEGTAPSMRAVVEHNLCPPGTVLRLYYVTPIFRYERPQKGRLRESHQVGLELIGSPSAGADAEIIEMTVAFYHRIGLEDVRVKLNSIGRDECRTAFREAILSHVAKWLSGQSEEDRAKTMKNPLRLLDSKDPDVQELVTTMRPILDFLEPESKERLDALKSLLDESQIPYEIDPMIVRGLDYYTETVFEVQSTSLGAQSALCGGGRYDNLVKEMGGQDTPSVGVAMGIERALIVMEAEGVDVPQDRPDAFIVTADPTFAAQARGLARELRAAGKSVCLDLDRRSMKSQLKMADRSRARLALLLGEDEVAGGFVTVRNLGTSEQRQVPRPEIAGALEP